MRLKQIKLAGFKSFVDLTKVPFEQQMTAIVGPNGCGKSNIIDAVRWVLGESSAKNLRGDTMTDVIFNGAASRKPVSQASVELLFDNTDQRFTNSMASRNEVAVRRVLNRDGTNTYYLNNGKCRRKDITDIFLGTGLGPRSYAIIEQGTISRLIESKPHELRVFIEEAAGISKYKERRRDTENRIRHTRENLSRLADIRSELTLQVDKLHQQAEAAKQFKTLKTQVRKYKAELCVLRYQQFIAKNENILAALNQDQDQVDKLQISVKDNDIELFNLKQQDSFNDETLNDIQQHKLQLTTDIARIEQTIKHLQQQNVQLKHDIERINKQLSDQQLLLQQSEQQHLSVDKWVGQEQENLSVIEQQICQLEQELEVKQQDQQLCQLKWDDCYQQQNKQREQQALLKGKLLSQQQLLLEKNSRQSEIAQALSQNEKLLKTISLKHLNEQLLTEKQILENNVDQQQVLEKQKKDCASKLNAIELKISQQQGLKTAFLSNLLQLENTQNKHPDWFNQQTTWLNKSNIETSDVLHKKILVTPPWQKACEQVLNQWLQAQVVKELPNQLPEESRLNTALIIKNNAVPNLAIKNGTLAAMVSGEYAFTALLNNIYLADNFSQAQQLLATLSVEQSVICSDGTWLGHQFLRKGTVDKNSGLLQQHQDIIQLKDKIEHLGKALEHDRKATLQLTASVAEADLAVTQNIKQIQQKQLLVNKLEQEVALEQQKSQQLHSQQTTWQQQLIDVETQTSQINIQLASYQQQQQSIESQDEMIDLFEQLSQQKKQLQQTLTDIQQQLKQLQNERHQSALSFEQAKYQKNQIDLSDVQTQKQCNDLKSQVERSNKQLVENKEPLTQHQNNLQAWLSKLSGIEENLVQINEGQIGADLSIKKTEQNKAEKIKQISQIKERINQKLLSAESFKLRAQSSLDQLHEQQQNYDDVMANTPKNIQEGVWQTYIVRLSKQLSQLGAINLAAIDEYESQFERKNYLDQQNDDLTEAISTLESAIAKIDKESRHKFQLTFDKVNSDLKLLFPKVFGGGHAYLEMTGQDFLDTGITLMARPPGKKNSTIHLLSGGEKALTALSLVFAIFRLNPAPFCMLDEVDAPLDDANVERFCNLVREMSQTVQFIYISHNKIAMEMASHLTGVTMFEPGVSRMVAVDIDEAVAMAEIVPS